MTLDQVRFYYNDEIVGGVDEAMVCLKDMKRSEGDAILKELIYILLNYDMDRLADIVISRRYSWMDRDLMIKSVIKEVAQYVDDCGLVVYTDTFLCQKEAGE